MLECIVDNDDTSVRFPLVPEVLLKALKRSFPDRLPSADTPDYKIRVMMGQQEVIRFLECYYKLQQEN